MKNRNSSEDLNAQIAALEAQRKEELAGLKKQLHETGQSLKPANLVKSAMQDVAANPQVKSVFAKAAIGLALGLVAKGVMSVRSHHKRSNRSVASSLTKTAVTMGVNLLVSNRYKLLKTAGTLAATALINSWRNKRAQRKLNKAQLAIDNSSQNDGVAEDPTYSYSGH